jgi:hypothetical protein
MKTIAIFGCGAAGKRAWLHLRSRYKIAAFLDNDAAKQGCRIGGVRVFNPAGYDYDKVDHVFIASMFVDEILLQLLRLGVPSSKIEYVAPDDAVKHMVRSGGAPGLGPLHFLRRACYIPFRLLR